MTPRFARCTALALAVLTVAPATRAADTIETWDPGAGDWELHLGADGGRDAEQALYGQLVAGYGLVPRLSAYFELDGAVPVAKTASSEPHVGAFGTPVDTEHFDADLLFDLSLATPRPVLTPGVELNLDSAPDGRGTGVYLRLAWPTPEPGGFTLGAYATATDELQLLLEHDADSYWSRVALGGNLQLTEELELIGQLSIDFDRSAQGIELGVIVTLPRSPAGP